MLLSTKYLSYYVLILLYICMGGSLYAQAPTFDSLPSTLSDINCDDTFPTQETLTASTNAPGCGVSNVVASVDPFVPNVCTGYSVTYRWIATDQCGNADTVTESFNVLPDNLGPIISTQATDLTVECDGFGNTADLNTWLANNAGAIAADNCGTVSWTNDFTSLSDLCGATGSALVTFIVTDTCGNSSTTNATFTIEDTQAPTFTSVPNSLSDISCDANLPAQQTLTATDVCGNANVVASVDPFVADVCTGYTVTYRWIATDECGNADTVTESFDVLPDNVGPTISTQASDLTVECDGLGNTADLNTWLTNNAGAIAADNCGTVSWTNDFSSLSDLCGATGSAFVTFTATDTCGNISTTSATFTINDTQAPTITTAASNQTVECDGAGNAVALNAWLNSQGGAVASDDCGTVIWTNDYSSLSDLCGATGSATVTFTATDECGNTATPLQPLP